MGSCIPPSEGPAGGTRWPHSGSVWSCPASPGTQSGTVQSVSVSQRIKTDQRPAMAVYLLLNVCIFFKEILIFPREPYILPYI